VLHVGPRAEQQEQKRRDEKSLETAVKNAAKAIAKTDEEITRHVEVTTRVRTEKAAAAIEEEARKGFDLLVVGVGKVLNGKDDFDRKIEDLTSGFKGPIAIAAAKGIHLKQPAKPEFRILVPVSGSAVSRRGAEVAVALARLSHVPLRVVYVSTTRDKSARRNAASVTLAREEAILKDTAAAAARYDVDVTTSLQANASPDEAILREIKSSGVDLVVLGVDRIQGGDSLNFGSVATAILGKSKVSVLLVADGEAERKD